MNRFQLLLIALITFTFASCSFYYPKYFINKLEEDVILKVFFSPNMVEDQLKLLSIKLEGYKEENFKSGDVNLKELKPIEKDSSVLIGRIPAKSVTYLYDVVSGGSEPKFWELTTSKGTVRLDAKEIYNYSTKRTPYKFWGSKSYFELPNHSLKML